MEATIKFNLPEDQVEFETAVSAGKWKSVAWEMDQWLRKQTKYPLIYKRVLNGEGVFKIKGPDDKSRIARNMSHINHDRAKKLLFKIMETQIEGWWD